MNLTIPEQEPKDGQAVIDNLNKFLIEKYSLFYNKGFEYYVQEEEYSLYLYLNQQDRPVILSGQFESEQKFTEYVIKEMNKRKLFQIEYFNLYRTDENKGV